jgi:hypothetical protein
MFGRLFTLVLGGAAGAYGMNQYIETQARKGVFPDWNKFSSDVCLAFNETKTGIMTFLNDEETKKFIDTTKEKGKEAYK